MKTNDEIKELKEKLRQYNEWAKQYQKPNGWTVIPADAKPPIDVTNDDRSEVELYDFVHDKPKKYFLYVDEKKGIVTTWMGRKLGIYTKITRYKANTGDIRESIRVLAINGLTYYGTYYKSAGNYARITAYKQR